MVNGTGSRPLSEVSPVAQRRNSPSWNQMSKKMLSPSPFDSSPFNSSSSPRLFWKGRDSGSSFQSTNTENKSSYDPELSFSPPKRPSIENLKRVSRVKNSSMFAREQKQEYDPAHVNVLDRPLANGRPFRGQAETTSRTSVSPTRPETQQGNPETRTPLKGSPQRPTSPNKDQTSPAKSSLSKAARFGTKPFDPGTEIWSDGEGTTILSRLSDDQTHPRHAKSVKFDAAPPQINEYEMTTPVPSSVASESREGSYDFEEDEDEISFDRGSSLDRDDSFDASLEDTEKTPVVLPEDWRFMSPASANDELIQDEVDPFMDEQGSPGPEVLPPTRNEVGTRQSRVESLDSNGERRPLPPLPSSNGQSSPPRPATPAKLSSVFEHASGSQRVLPSPPGPATYTKSEINGVGRASMTLEDRLRLMMQPEESTDHLQSEADRQRERKMRRIGARERSSTHDSEDSGRERSCSSPPAENETSLHDVWSSPRISRESILRNLKTQDIALDESYEYSSEAGSSPDHLVPIDPDVPIPSLEDNADDVDDTVKEEQSDDEDIFAIPEYFGRRVHQDVPLTNAEQNVADDDDDDDEDSQYSQNLEDDYHEESQISSGSGDAQATPIPLNRDDQTVQPELPSLLDGDTSFLTSSFGSPDGALRIQFSPLFDGDESKEMEVQHLDMAQIRESLQRPATPSPQDRDEGDGPATPDSVIRHPAADDSAGEPIPGPVATIKAPGGDLKTRPSLTPADVQSMAAARRKVSGQETAMSSLMEEGQDNTHSPVDQSIQSPMDQETTVDHSRNVSSTNAAKRLISLVKLDIPLGGTDESLEFGLDKEFDCIIETQKVAFELSLSKRSYPLPPLLTQDRENLGPKETLVNETNTDKYAPKQRGYLMRQNTKVIIASSHNDDEQQLPNTENGVENSPAKSANSPRKASQPTWTAEPWNGKSRRQSVKMAGGPVKKKPVAGAVPPLPGMQSNVQDIQSPVDDNETQGISEQPEDGEERGRLFVKVIGVKDLDLPLPKGERANFSLTLDNGLHCVTTPWLELGKTASIGQEFELMVQNELEFQLTLQMKIDEAMFQPVRKSIVSASPPKQKSSTFSRVFASPKKRKELELRQILEQQHKQQKADALVNPGPWDKLGTLVNRDGSFARAYIALSEHEKHAFGRPYSVQVACFNEWAVEESSSVKSKKATSNGGVQRRPPYKIGYLELQLLYVPKPKGAKDEDMPKSMNACIREMREAENTSVRTWEGFLSQQGGDCPYWRRRFFRLQGSKLTAYHEVTRQPRATINLAKAAKLIDDKSALTQKETSTKGGGRRKSAFAEEEEGYMFVEEGFRIRFGNGEVIDFYADSRHEKEGWMKVLSETVGKGYAAGNGQVKAWTELVFRHERSLQSKREAADRLLGNAPPLPTPRKDTVTSPVLKAQAPLPPQKTSRHQHTLSQPEARRHDARREKTRSLIF